MEMVKAFSFKDSVNRTFWPREDGSILMVKVFLLMEKERVDEAAMAAEKDSGEVVMAIGVTLGPYIDLVRSETREFFDERESHFLFDPIHIQYVLQLINEVLFD